MGDCGRIQKLLESTHTLSKKETEEVAAGAAIPGCGGVMRDRHRVLLDRSLELQPGHAA